MTRVCRFLDDHDEVVLGALEDDGLVRRSTTFASLGELIDAHPSGAREADLGLEDRSVRPKRLLPPVAPARNVFCVGWNYRDHFEEGAASRPERAMPDHPSFFTKLASSLVGPYDPIDAHSGLTGQLDWEAELGVVIGSPLRDGSEEDALAAVFGYLVANDVSARDVQAAHGGQWFRGKSLDATSPVGPGIVPTGEIADPQSLQIRCWVNGVERQSASTSQMVFPIARILSELSAGLTLLPGDLVLTGTPSGVGHHRTPPLFLHSGDEVVTEIAGVGVLRNVVR